MKDADLSITVLSLTTVIRADLDLHTYVWNTVIYLYCLIPGIALPLTIWNIYFAIDILTVKLSSVNIHYTL